MNAAALRGLTSSPRAAGWVWLKLAQPGLAVLLQMRRVTFGKSSQTFTPQKCEPSVQIGVVIPART